MVSWYLAVLYATYAVTWVKHSSRGWQRMRCMQRESSFFSTLTLIPLSCHMRSLLQYKQDKLIAFLATLLSAHTLSRTYCRSSRPLIGYVDDQGHPVVVPYSLLFCSIWLWWQQLCNEHAVAQIERWITGHSRATVSTVMCNFRYLDLTVDWWQNLNNLIFDVGLSH